jgi:tRNA pseudouridine55 synthase
MLPVCLGQATKVCGFLLDSDKEYRFKVRFGVATTTGDAEGTVTRTGPAEVATDLLEATIEGFHGRLQQIPPMYSALKHRGRRLYELARAGHEVPRNSREIHIYSLVVESHDTASPVLRVRCSKGTYVRTLAEQIAEKAGTVGHVLELRRLSVDPFAEPHMVTMEALEDAADGSGPQGLDQWLLPADRALDSWPALRLSSDAVTAIRCGQAVVGDGGTGEGLVRLYGDGGQFVGIGERLAGGQVVPRRLMETNPPASAQAIGL